MRCALTPARAGRDSLVAHMRSTAGFTLQHVQFLVVDEADRLLRQAYQARARAGAPACAPAWPRNMLTALAPQDWLPHVLAATSPSAQASLPWGVQPAAEALTLGAAAPLIAAQRRCRGGLQGDRAVTPRTVKLVVSATLTRDPSKIGRLELYAPLLLTAAQDEQRCVRRTPRRKCLRACAHTRRAWFVQVSACAAAAPMARGCAR